MAIIVTVFLSALDVTSVGTALPTIVAHLNGGENFAWVGSAYALSSTAFLPLSGTLADVFGRRPIMLISVALFSLGSALAGSAQNMNWLIAARTVQGIGGGAIINMSEIIVSDLVPLAERGLYQGLVGLTWAFACGVGPPIGGAFAGKASWRWLFYINLPLSGIAFTLVLFFLRVRTPEGSITSKVKRVDWFGNLIVICGTTLAVTGLTFGGGRFAWVSAEVLAPLIIGLILIVAFLYYEGVVPKEPTIPWEVLSNRTTIGGYLATLVHGITSIGVIYYVSVYFQAVLGASPIMSGVDSLVFALMIAAGALTSGIAVQVQKKYVPVNVAGWIFMMVGFGVLSLMRLDSSKSQWLGYQVLIGVGVGLLFPSPLFSVLAPLPVERNAAALAFFAFTRAFAQTWGITIAGTILQNELTKRLPTDFISQFPGGSEIAFAAIPVIGNLSEPLRTEVREAFATSLSMIWKIMAGISGAGLLSLLLLKEIPMNMEMNEKYGLHGDNSGKNDDKSEKGNAIVSEETV
ncbi:MFS general substrate transporter [Irpex rosettiformis]|uniref:MFS general substrate transporter n=1 Tax=Irpex rosettiformis TaxID=378272 RepID=A0ACB8U1R5_9APHY|nr:MFS general substrate transporter [Irpex rosettiformis]